MNYASFSQRLLAHNVDLMPILLVLYALSFAIARSDFDWIWVLLTYYSYHIFFEASSWGATPGKKANKMIVTDLSGNRPSPFRIIARNVLKIPSLLFLFSGFLMILFNRKRQGLHDWLTGTVVIVRKE